MKVETATKDWHGTSRIKVQCMFVKINWGQVQEIESAAVKEQQIWIDFDCSILDKCYQHTFQYIALTTIYKGPIKY